MKKTLFVLRVNNFRPDLCEYTIPTIRFWAKRNGWEYREINERFLPKAPVTYEKLQISWLGDDSDWNLLCDADVMLKPTFLDPTSFFNPNTVGSSYGFAVSAKFKSNIYFERDGRNLGLSGGFILSSRLTHDLWNLPHNFEEALDGTEKNPHLIDEYVISTNLARYGLKHSGVSNDPDNYIHHFGQEIKHETAMEKVKDLWLDWCEVWPDLTFQNQDKSS